MCAHCEGMHSGGKPLATVCLCRQRVQGRTAAKPSHPSWLGHHIQHVPLCVRLSGEKERVKLETDGENDTHRPGIHSAVCRVQSGA